MQIIDTLQKTKTLNYLADAVILNVCILWWHIGGQLLYKDWAQYNDTTNTPQV